MYDPERLGQPIAAGRTAEIYAWEAGQVLKLFRPGWEEADANYEAYKARAVHAAGLPAPAVGDVVQVGPRFGIVYERVEGIPFVHPIRTQPWALRRQAEQFADLHWQISQARADNLPPLRPRLERAVQRAADLPEDARRTVLALLETLPDGQAICHGDFHPENITLTERGPVILDWMDATQGSPLADAARSAYLLAKAALPPDMPGKLLIQLIRERFTRTYLNIHLARLECDPQEWSAWQTVIAAGRLAENIPHERKRLLQLVQSGLEGR
jgi:thiamine kinase